MISMADAMPELVLVAETDPAAARRARRLAGRGVLKRLYPSIYTSNVDSPPESIVLRHWQAIIGHLLPGGVISHRSAFDSRPFEGSLSITRGKTRRDVRLPGLTIHIVPGPGPRLEPPAPVQRRQRPHGAARHELHVERARVEPNHHSDGIPGRLLAARKL